MSYHPKVSSTQSWFAAPYLRGYAPIRISSMTDLRFYKFATTGNPWYVAYHGITFDGICGAHTCSQYEKKVSCKLAKGGYGKFDVAKDSCDFVCPCCQKPLKILNTCSFHNCKWKYTGVVQDPSASESEPTNKYIKRNGRGVANAKNGYFEYTGDVTNWRFLEFTVEKIPENELIDL